MPQVEQRSDGPRKPGQETETRSCKTFRSETIALLTPLTCIPKGDEKPLKHFRFERQGGKDYECRRLLSEIEALKACLSIYTQRLPSKHGREPGAVYVFWVIAACLTLPTFRRCPET